MGEAARSYVPDSIPTKKPEEKPPQNPSKEEIALDAGIDELMSANFSTKQAVGELGTKELDEIFPIGKTPKPDSGINNKHSDVYSPNPFSKDLAEERRRREMTEENYPTPLSARLKGENNENAPL